MTKSRPIEKETGKSYSTKSEADADESGEVKQ